MRSVKVRVVVIVGVGVLDVIVADIGNKYCTPHGSHNIEDYYAQSWTTTRRALIHLNLSKLSNAVIHGKHFTLFYSSSWLESFD